ncbi:hypothetical protein SAMN05443551_0062 [Marivita hallyeonensis]|uniref:Uncharacterized protein n=1 Tax=Marivita hallyeonensis TaxID=996342 RepID=A0A1M5Y3N9_9RHOB|nr:hypothetical protein SAMN05443551_0062 [Marivita hallyeonensis]
MNAYFDPRQLDHAPETYFRGGAPMPHPEQPERATLLRALLEEMGVPVLAPKDYGLDPMRTTWRSSRMRIIGFGRSSPRARWVAQHRPADPRYERGSTGGAGQILYPKDKYSASSEGRYVVFNG